MIDAASGRHHLHEDGGDDERGADGDRQPALAVLECPVGVDLVGPGQEDHDATGDEQHADDELARDVPERGGDQGDDTRRGGRDGDLGVNDIPATSTAAASKPLSPHETFATATRPITVMTPAAMAPRTRRTMLRSSGRSVCVSS